MRLIFSLIFLLSAHLCLAQQYYSAGGAVNWKDPVASVGALPSSGNAAGDARFETTAFGLYVWNGSSWTSVAGGGGGSGTVTSVGLALPASIFSVSGSPVTVSGTLTGSLATQTANKIWSGPTSGGAATPTFRTLVAADIPSLSYQPVLSTSTAPAHQFGTGFTAPNTFSFAQPDFSDLTGTATTAQGGTNHGNYTAGSIPFAGAGGTSLTENNAQLFWDNATERMFIGNNASIGGSNAGIQYSDATTANRGQIKLHSYFNGASVAGVSTLTSRSGVVGTNAAVVAGQDYSKWTAQAGATTPGSAPISGTWSFKANTVNSLTVTSDYHLQLTNLAGTLGDRLYLTSEGLLQLPGYGAGYAKFDSSGNVSSSATVSPADIPLATNHILVGSAGGVAADVTMNGDVGILANGSTAIANVPEVRYIDFVNGSDITGTGSETKPWKTIQFAYTSSAPTINVPFIFYLRGGNNDTDVGTITGKPNVTLYSEVPIQVAAPLTISGGATNDNIGFNNIIFIGAVTWIRNDATIIGVTMINTQFFSGPVFKQNGSGSFSVTSENSVSVNMDIETGGTGSFFTGHNFLGSTTFEDANTSAYYQIMGGYVGGAMSIAGGPFVYFSGIQFDVPFGASLTTSTTANGTPTLQTDSGSVPASITGPNSLVLQSFAHHESYTPAIPGNWSPSPSQVASALDQLATRTSSVPTETVVTKTGNYTVLLTDQDLVGDATASQFTFTLPSSASAFVGGKSYVFTFTKKDSTTNVVHITAAGGDLITGGVTINLVAQWDTATIFTDGGGTWYVR